MGTKRSYGIAVIAGDGIGLEVVPAALSVLHEAGRQGGFTLECKDFSWGCDYHAENGYMMPENALELLEPYNAIFLGAVGSPQIAEHVPVWGLVLPIRKGFDQYVNLRPMRLLPGIVSPLGGRGVKDVDMVCVRENSEGEYSGIGKRRLIGTPGEVAEQTAIFTRRGVERIVRYAFELASRRPRKMLASATKSNALQHSMVMWDEIVDAIAEDYPSVWATSYHIDALAARMVSHPQTLDVIVASNLFGDILTDLGAAISGSLGMGASGNINPERRYPSMFEAIHGSAPDIAGQGIANPIGATWAGAMLLQHIGEAEAARRVMRAIERVLLAGEARTPDLGGDATTEQMTAAIAAAL
ncbi:MAG: tartrate dehydrogenase [bacterium]|nr:tartrate dehydrogenase [bacterium]